MKMSNLGVEYPDRDPSSRERHQVIAIAQRNEIYANKYQMSMSIQLSCSLHVRSVFSRVLGDSTPRFVHPLVG